MANTSRNTIKSTRTTFRIIEALQQLDGAGVTEITEHLDLSKGNVYKYMKTLEEERYIVKDVNNQYHLGLRFLSLGANARRQREIYETAKPQIMELAKQSNEMANLMVEEHGRGTILYRSDSRQAVNLDTHAGREVYLHTTAVGKAILAHLSRTQINEIVDQHGLPRMTENTITDRETLLAELEEIADQGWAYDNEERLAGLRCVGAVLLNPNEKPLGAISISGPSSRMNGSRFTEDLPEMILNAKSIIELNIAYG